MSRSRAVLGAALSLLFVVALTSRMSAHDIPRDVTVQAFAKPQGRTFTLLVRVPLRAIMDIEFPRRERDFVDLDRVDQSLRDAAMIWLARKIALYEEDAQLPPPRIVATRMSLESDRSFASYEQALAHLNGPALTNDTSIFWEQGILDVQFEYPIRSHQSHFSIHMAFEQLGLRVVTALRFMPPGGVIRAYELEGDAGLVPLDPRWVQAVLRFVKLGFVHILDGTDHLLFLFCLVIPFRRIRPLVAIVTAFTIAHSLTLLASAQGYAPDALWFPPLIETLIAASIVYMALENIVDAKLRRRWVIAFAFGLIHGFGFSFGLQHTMQFAGAHLMASLLSFNIGVELGQLFVLLLFVPALELLFRYVIAERMGTIILSAFVVHTAWHWMTDRLDALRQYPWPVITAAGLAGAMRWTMVLVGLVGLAWLLSGVIQRLADEGGANSTSAPAA